MTTHAVNFLDPLAVTLSDTVLIEASAGTGKTYTITTLVARLVAEGYPVESVLVVTFTEAAAAELKLRIRDRLARCAAGADEELSPFFAAGADPELVRRRLALAVTCFDQAAVMTIHAFCLSVLKENAFESGSFFDMELLPDSGAFFDQAVMDFFGMRVNDQDPVFLAYLSRAGVTPERFRAVFSKAVSRPGIRTLPQGAAFRDIGDDYRKTVETLSRTLSDAEADISRLIQDHPGIDKRSYSKRNVPAWLARCREQLAAPGPVFDMTEKGDPLYKFTRTRLSEKTKKGAPPAHAFFDRCEDLLDLTRALGENLVRLRLDFIPFFRESLERMKQTTGGCFFDDLVNDLWAALSREGALKQVIRSRYRACLIDEFQDTDPVQYKIFSRLFNEKGTPFFMIGDPKQAIYAFRGGDIFAYLTAGQRADQAFTLGKNYRSAPGLVRAVNRLFAARPDPFGFEEIPFIPVGVPDTAQERLFGSDGVPVPPLQVAFASRGPEEDTITKTAFLERIPRVLARDVLAVLTDGTLRLTGKNAQGPSGETTCDPNGGALEGTVPPGPGDMAVLVRTNDQAEAVRKALARTGIPAYLSKTGSVYDSPEALELFDLLSAVNAPDNTGFVKAALSGSLFGCGGEYVDSLNGTPGLLDLWQARFADWNKLFRSKGFLAMINQVFHGGGVDPGPGTRCSERALTNHYHLVELVSKAALQRSLEGPYLLAWYERQLDPGTREGDADELRLESEGQAVAIVTIHKSKGLEYPIVFLPYLWDSKRFQDGSGTALFHDPGADFELTLDLGSPDLAEGTAQAAREQEAEEMRLLYVALTRASAMCRIYWAGVAGCDRSALGRILHPGGAGDDGAMCDEIDALARTSDSGIARAGLSPAPGAYQAERSAPRDLSPRIFSRQASPAWRITSYSGLAASLSRDMEFQGPFGDERDRGGADEGTAADAIEPKGGAAPGLILLESFPKGAGAGDFFHHVLETVDFEDPAGIEPAVAAGLDRFGFGRDRFLSQVSRAMGQILETALCGEKGPGFTLSDIPKTARFTELEFCFDIRNLDLTGLSDLLDADPRVRGYGGRLRQMAASGFKGYIKGFIDLVVCHEGLWYILDYKSNFLGAAYSDYSEKHVDRAMSDHDYILQYHLYLVALDRYLSLRLKGYDYETHFGGVFYLFIRGMKKEAGTGVFYHRPGTGTMARLRELF